MAATEPPDGGQEGDAKFRLMFERSSDAILLLDTQSNHFVEYNQATLDMLRCSRAELEAMHPSRLSPARQPDGRDSFEKANEMIALALERGSHRFEWVHRSPHRDDFPVEVLLTPIQPGTSPLVMVVWRDITERKAAERALLQAQKRESLGVLAGGLAHDFNNLLTAMIGHACLARSELGATSTADHHLEQIELAVEKAAVLTQQMLAYSGRATTRPGPVDISRSVAEMASLLKVSLPKGVRLEPQLGTSLPAVQADGAQIQQVIMNLVTNAAEAIGPREGVIGLRTELHDIDDALLSQKFAGQALRLGPCVCLTIEDNGCGMSPEVQARIFDPFFTTKQTGRGLGLSSLLGILRNHQAGIHIDSQPGRGTRVEVAFPASSVRTRAAADLPADDKRAPVAAHRGTVLLVDDEDYVRQSVGAMLRNLGFAVREATDGVVALEVFRATPELFTLVMLDVAMPKLDGVATLRELRALAPQVPVVLCSGWAEDNVGDDVGGALATAHLSKPFSLKDLELLLRRLLSGADILHAPLREQPNR